MNTAAEHTCTEEKCEVTRNEEATPARGVERIERRQTYLPAADVIDGEKETLLALDMPGVAPDDLELTVEDGVLYIKGKQAAEDFGGRELVYSEYGVGDYERRFALADSADKEGISASLKDGVLTVRIPKAVPASKKITVAAG